MLKKKISLRWSPNKAVVRLDLIGEFWPWSPSPCVTSISVAVQASALRPVETVQHTGCFELGVWYDQSIRQAHLDITDYIIEALYLKPIVPYSMFRKFSKNNVFDIVCFILVSIDESQWQLKLKHESSDKKNNIWPPKIFQSNHYHWRKIVHVLERRNFQYYIYKELQSQTIC